MVGLGKENRAAPDGLVGVTGLTVVTSPPTQEGWWNVGATGVEFRRLLEAGKAAGWVLNTTEVRGRLGWMVRMERAGKGLEGYGLTRGGEGKGMRVLVLGVKWEEIALGGVEGWDIRWEGTGMRRVGEWEVTGHSRRALGDYGSGGRESRKGKGSDLRQG